MARNANTTNGAGLVLSAMIFIAVGIGVLIGVQRFIADARYVAHTNAVIAQVDAFEARLRDAESAQRGFLLTSDVDYLAAYRINQAQLTPILQELKVLVADNAPQMARVDQMVELEQQRFKQIADNLDRFRESGLEAARAGIDAQTPVVSSRIRALSRQMVAEEEALLVQRSRSSQRSANVLRGLALLGIPLGILLLGGVFARLLHEVRRRALAENRAGVDALRLQSSVAELEQHSAALSELNQYARLLQNCHQPEEAVALTTEQVARWLPGSVGTVYRIRASRDYAEALAQWGQAASPAPVLVAPGDCWSLRRGLPHTSHAGQTAARCTHLGPVSPDRPATESICIPLTAQGVQLGFMQMYPDQNGMQEYLPLVQAAAEQLAMTLHTLSLQERLRVQSIRDPLTGLYNRRYLEESLSRELARCHRRQLPVSLMMLDVDHFKAFNDKHGHPGGDALLAALGKVLEGLVRTEDIACRYGGEEFTLILPETGIAQARERAAMVLAAVSAMQVAHMGHVLPPVTASIGVAETRQDEGGMESLLQRADSALYQAKQAGRNTVVVDGVPPAPSLE